MAITIIDTKIDDIKIIRPDIYEDERGSFSETYNKKDFIDKGLDFNFVQDNQAFSIHKHTLRGMHFQKPPFAQAKLVRVLKGAILDIVIDIRRHSKTYGQHVSVELSENNRHQLWIPKGFAHGLLTLEANTKVLYKTTEYYNKSSEAGLLWNDDDLNIAWPVSADDIIINKRDSKYPRLKDCKTPF